MEQKLLEIARKILKTSDITLDTKAEDIESWDSLAHIRLIMEIEREFGVSIPIDDVANIESLRDFLKYLKKG